MEVLKEKFYCVYLVKGERFDELRTCDWSLANHLEMRWVEHGNSFNPFQSCHE